MRIGVLKSGESVVGIGRFSKHEHGRDASPPYTTNQRRWHGDGACNDNGNGRRRQRATATTPMKWINPHNHQHSAYAIHRRPIWIGIAAVMALLFGALALLFGPILGIDDPPLPPSPSVPSARPAVTRTNEPSPAPRAAIETRTANARTTAHADDSPGSSRESSAAPLRRVVRNPIAEREALMTPPASVGKADLVVEVTRFTGEPIGGAWIEVSRPDTMRRGETDAMGRCEFMAMADGAWKVYVGHSDHSVALHHAVLVADQSTTIAVRLGRPTTIRGTVTDFSGQPIPRAAVRLAVPLPETLGQNWAVAARTDEEGFFELDVRLSLQSTAFTLTASASGHESATINQLPPDGMPVDFRLRPYPGGRVQLSSGHGAVTAGRATAFRLGGSPRDAADWVQLAFSPEQPLRWPNFAPGTWAVLIETPAGHWFGHLDAPTDFSRADRVFALEPNRTVQVDVRWADTGEAAIGAKIVISCDEMPRLSWRSDIATADGAIFPALPAMPILVTVNGPTGRPVVQTPLDLTAADPIPRLVLELPRE